MRAIIKLHPLLLLKQKFIDNIFRQRFRGRNGKWEGKDRQMYSNYE